jgi:hypothetical protein
MKKTKRRFIPGIKKDGTPKIIIVPKRRGRPWASMLEPHYEEIRLSRARGEIYEAIGGRLGRAASTVASFVRTHSDGTRPYTLPPLRPAFSRSPISRPCSSPSITTIFAAPLNNPAPTVEDSGTFRFGENDSL